MEVTVDPTAPSLYEFSKSPKALCELRPVSTPPVASPNSGGDNDDSNGRRKVLLVIIIITGTLTVIALFVLAGVAYQYTQRRKLSEQVCVCVCESVRFLRPSGVFTETTFIYTMHTLSSCFFHILKAARVLSGAGH